MTAAYRDWESWRGSMAQLAINLLGILIAGTATLAIQRALYDRRRRRHLREPGPAAREPVGAAPPARG